MKYTIPNVISALIFIGLIIVQFNYTSTSHYATSGIVTVKSGIGTPLTTTYDHGKKSRSFNWGILLRNAIACYLLAQACSQLAIRRTLFARPIRLYFVIAISISMIGLVIAGGWSKKYWGYYFVRPPLPHELTELSAVSGVVPLQTYKDEHGIRHFAVREDASIEKDIQNCASDPYYCLDERVLAYLKERDLLPKRYSTESDLMRMPLHQALAKTKMIKQPEEGYDTSQDFGGLVVDGTNKTGTRLLFLAAAGGQLSNDHYPYYETVWKFTSTSDIELISGQSFFFDVAGIEGLEWQPIWILISIAGLVLVLPALAIISALLYQVKGRPNQAL